ncbi:nucleoside triphosphate pyrophosphohydrolase family protein [Pyruvatibacter sp.]|uniref:nucleoside triphosphate pyrophosphohydrolase family protein n=1 Tax=Pyruvatibacter sp. TaxID=1981328 RepID=UPI003266CDEE
MFDNLDLPDAAELSISEYATLAHKTNQLNTEKETLLDLPMLGFLGEAGSLLSAVKKQKRDELPHQRYRETVREEVGDFLWYLSLIAATSRVSLEEVARNTAKMKIETDGALRFIDLDNQFALSRRPPIERLISQLTALGGDVGKFADWHAHNRRNITPDVVAGHLSPILRQLLRACAAADVRLHDAAYYNLHKIYDRWPLTRKRYPDLYDATHEDKTEQLPRKVEIRIEQRAKRGKFYVFQTCRDINIGDPLTDNISDPDFYRFHDVFHYAYASVLGWSPVTRALFKLKRKSDPELDENEDGARAILVEEGLSTIIFNQAKAQRFFEDIERGELSFDLLKTVRDFVRGYEVESAPLWLWEEAILSGYECFRFLKEKKSGIAVCDMKKRRIQMKELTG